MRVSPSKVAPLSCVVLVFGVTQGWSQDKWVPPPIPGQNVQAPATVTEELVKGLQVGPVRIVLEDTPLDSVQHRLRAGPIGQAGDAASFIEWLCLRGGNGPDGWMLWLESGEMGAGTVEGFHLMSVPAVVKGDDRCRHLPLAMTVAIPNHLALGLPDSIARRLVGPPSAVVGDTLIYWHMRDVQNRLFLVIERGRVVQIAVWRSSAL